MKTVRVNTALFVLCAVLALSGCHKKKPSAQVPQPPTPAASSEPPPVQQPQQPAQEPPSAQQPSQQPQTANDTRTKPQPKHARHTAAASPKKPATANNDKPSPDKPAPEKQTQEVARNLPPKIVIQEGSSSNPASTQISPGNSQDNNGRNEATTGQLLDSTENNLRNIKRQLSSDEQSTVAQIRDYVSQSRQAIKDGDMVRAHNLALKAHLLSEELAKQH